MRADCTLLDDDAGLSRIARMQRRTWTRHVRPVMLGFFDIEIDARGDRVWVQKRLRKERLKIEAQRKQRSEAGKKGARKKSENYELLQPENNPQGGSKSDSNARKTHATQPSVSNENNDLDLTFGQAIQIQTLSETKFPLTEDTTKTGHAANNLLPPHAIDEGRKWTFGHDIYAIEAEFLKWVEGKGIHARDITKLFVSFVKRHVERNPIKFH